MPYKAKGYQTVLLVEKKSIVLVSELKMLNAIRKAYPDGLPTYLDEIWYADTSIPSQIAFKNFTPMMVHR